MKPTLKDVQIVPISNDEPVPYSLLLLADPSESMIHQYLVDADIFLVKQQSETIGVIVLCPLSRSAIEIKAIAVIPTLQGQGVGSFMISHVIGLAKKKNYSRIQIATANSSIGQLYLYQKMGFDITEIKK